MQCSCDSSIYGKFTLQRCKHIVCKKCLYNYIQKNLSSAIKCPMVKCKENISDPNIRKFISDAEENIYETKCVTNLAKMCQTKGCAEFEFPKPGETDLFVECLGCKQPICFQCNMRHLSSDCLKSHKEKQSIEEECDRNGAEILKRKRRNDLMKYDESTNLFPNITDYVCGICGDYHLPKEGVTLRCSHDFCKSCLEECFETSENYNDLECPKCNESLHEIEKIELIGEEKLRQLSNRIVAPRLYSCQTPDCPGYWDYSTRRGMVTCYECKQITCMSCEANHDKLTCEQYKNSDVYKHERKIKKSNKSIKCQCGIVLFKKGGCNALYCKNCRRQICLFTGLLAGKDPPEGCGCTSMEPCHKSCEHGCIPE